MAINKHKDCEYFDRIDTEQGFCTKYPPVIKNDGREEYIKVKDNEKACGVFVLKV